METAYAGAVVRDIHRELSWRFQQRVSEYGAGFVDVVYQCGDQHGKGRVGFHCEFSGARTYASGCTLLEFARKHFGTGRLKRLPAQAGDRAGLVRWAVMRETV